MNPGPAYAKIAKSAKAPVALLPLLPSCKRNPDSVRGTVILVTLCFVAVLGIVLASYLAVCSRAMQMSNRNFQSDLSKQLAEAGLEEAFRAFNKNDWSGWAANPSGLTGGTTAWSLDSTNKRAARTITLNATKLGQGATATIKLRVDNYDVHQLSANWSATANYRTNDVVGRSGLWYRCVLSNVNQTPRTATTTSTSTATYWIEEQMPLAINWNYPISYKQESVVYYNNSWYRCILTHTSSSSIPPTNTTYWTAISIITTNVTTSSSNNESLLHYWSGTTWAWWRYASGWDSSPLVTWRWRGSYPYVVDDVVAYNGVWYRCTAATSSTSSPNVNTSFWTTAPSNTSWTWNSSSYSYALNDVVYYSGSWYRCILAHSSSATVLPTNTTYWSNAPLFSPNWNTGKQYSQYDVVRYDGVWYLSLQNTNIGNNPATASTYWIAANTTNASYTWNRSTSYSAGVYRCYDGVWYKSIASSTDKSPNDTTYWTPTWSQSLGVTTGAPVIYSEAIVTLGDNTTSRTQLRAPIRPASLFPNAVAANSSTISANSGGTVDSYDSTTGTYASQVNSTTNYSAVLASAYSAGTAITLASTTVKGYLSAPSSSTSPFAPLYSSGGTVKGYSSSPSPNIDLSRISRSPYIPKFDPVPAGGLATTWNSIAKGTALTLSLTTNIGIAGATTPARYYYNGNLTVGSASLQTLRIHGPVILYINGNLIITASGTTGRIELSNNAKAEIHITGAFQADSSGDGIVNYTNDPKSLIIISDTTSTASHYYSEGVYPLYGTIYIPNSTSTTGYYNNNNSAEIYGAVSANKVTFSGANMNVHYDTSLRNATFGGVDQPYTVTNWTELSTTEAATMP